MRMLLRRIAGEAPASAHVMIEPRLVMRDSTMARPARPAAAAPPNRKRAREAGSR
jgi:hypothetical protein